MPRSSFVHARTCNNSTSFACIPLLCAQPHSPHPLAPPRQLGAAAGNLKEVSEPRHGVVENKRCLYSEHATTQKVRRFHKTQVKRKSSSAGRVYEQINYYKMNVQSPWLHGTKLLNRSRRNIFSFESCIRRRGYCKYFSCYITGVGRIFLPLLITGV